MNLKQSILANFFKGKKARGSESESESESDGDSIYLPSKSKRMFDMPMYWTRVKIVKLLATRNRTGQEVADLFNVKLQVVRDLNKDSKRK